LGVALIAAVLGLNWWQDRRARLHVQRHFGEFSGVADPLADSARASHDGRKEPALGASAAERQTERQTDRQTDADDLAEIDPACEVVIDVNFAQPIAGTLLRPALKTLDEVGGKPIRIFAKRANDASDANSDMHHAHSDRQIHDDQAYAALQLALLIANRSGPLTAIDWSQFWNHAEELAERFDAVLEGPEQASVIAQAERLDAFCARLDVQVGLNLVLAHAQPLTAILALARDLGFVLVDGRLLWLADEGLTRFALSQGEDGLFDGTASHGKVQRQRLTLLIDVPHSPANDHAFSFMAGIARELAARLDAQLLDDQGKPVVEASQAAIDAHLASLYAQLQAADMQAGSPRAKRVFA